MIEDVYEPLSRYRDEFRARHAGLTRAQFDELVERSGVDARANRSLVSRIRTLERQSRSLRGRLVFRAAVAVLCLLAAVLGGVALWLDVPAPGSQARIGVYAAVVAAVASCILAVRACLRLTGALHELQAQIVQMQTRARTMLAPLFGLFTWEMPAKLVEQTVPRLAFDPYFTEKRLEDLHRLCGWDDAFNDGKSVLCSQSGVINGNPFVFADCLVAGWGRETYHGTLDISWLEEEEDDEGRTRLVRRHETLHASVEKPRPVYSRDKLLVYGNDAAPDLSFTRRPSALSGETGGFLKSWRKRRARKRLEAFSRNLDDDSNYTIMANREFETLFETTDRTDEVQYRVLFTALAQRQMLELLNDRKVGFGDDFTFKKRRKINVIRADHLSEADLDTDPSQYVHWDLDEVARNFRSFNERFFKNVYFSLAPLLAIPAYQQTRPHADIWKGIVPESPSSFWEHEALANYHGEAAFRHPACATRSILKTRVVESGAAGTRVAVTAYGYRTEDRVDYVSVWGGDGNCHDVPVHWDEYLPVSRTREMAVTERATPADGFAAAFSRASATAHRRSIYSYLH